jgi:hypothetical protein
MRGKQNDRRPYQGGIAVRTILGYMAEILNERTLARTGIGHIQERKRALYGRFTHRR